MESLGHLEEVLEVGLGVGPPLQQGGGVELAGAEADVGLHVGQLRGQQVSDHLHRHVLPARLLTHAQGPEGAHMVRGGVKTPLGIILDTWMVMRVGVDAWTAPTVLLTYFSSLVLHMISSLQLTKMVPISVGVRRPDSDMGLWNT